MALGDEIDKILSDFGKVTVDDVRANLDAAVSYGGQMSKLSANIRYIKPFNSNGGIVLQIEMPTYGYILDAGRGKAKSDGTKLPKEAIENIEKWIVRRGLKPKMSEAKQKFAKDRKSDKQKKNQNREKAVKQFAFAIARKIQKEGHSQPYKDQKLGFWSKVINDGRLDELTKRISEVLKTEVIIEINDGINS
jgi:hypothetical protein